MLQVPSIGAGVVAMLAGWIIDDMLQPFLGMGPTLLASFVGSTVVFFAVRKWLRELRGG
jgi:uncharacterized membrane protein YdjX (TVP38/TMEM64 family)